MQKVLPYLLMPVMAGLLVLGQTMWGTVIRGGHALEGSPQTVVMNLLRAPRMWLGVAIYIFATLLYFFMLSKLRFFSVLLAIIRHSIVFSTALAAVVFHERPGAVNLLGALIVLAGVGMVLYK